MIMGGNNPATATTEIIDLGATPLKWKSGPNMSQARIEMNAVILPTGKILALGGSVNDEDTGSLSLNADLYDPATNTFSSAGANAYPRLYHSVALLLPDATVWLAGGNPTRGSYEPHMEIYKPAYFFNSSGGLATRPTITSAPSTVSWGSAFTVPTPDAANISSVVLMRPGADSRVRHGPAAGGDVLHRGKRNLDGDRAAQRQHRPAGVLHAVPGEQQRRALGREVYSARYHRQSTRRRR